MSEEIVAKRYAGALFQIGQEKATSEKIEQELRITKEVFQNNSNIFIFLKHPRVHMEKKKQLLGEAFQGFSLDVISTLKILMERHRIELLPSIIDHFIGLMNDAKGIAEAKVYSVRELAEDEKQEISTVFAKKLNKTTLKIDNIIDPTILGGLKLRIGNTIYDGTISGKLERIEQDIGSAN